MRALFAALRRTELDLLGGDPDQQAAIVDLQLRARDHQRDATCPGAQLGVLELDGVPIGQLDLWSDGTSVDVLELHVVPGLRGHGVGAAALRAVLADADAAATPVRLHVEVGSAARRLYERLGFAAVAATPTHVAMVRTGPEPTEGPGAAPPAPAPPAAVDGAPEPPPPPPTALPTYDDLAPHVGAAVPCAGGPDLELVAVDARRGRTAGGQVPYSAVLAGPLDAPLPQQIHTVELPGCGSHEVFLVPIEPADGRARYEMLVN